MYYRSDRQTDRQDRPVYLVGLWQDDDGHGSCVNALHPGGQAHLGDPLDPVCPSLMLQTPHGAVHLSESNQTIKHTNQSYINADTFIQ